MVEPVAVLDQVLELTVLLGDDMTTTLAARGLTPSRTHLLWVLKGTGPVPQRVLAEALGVSARTVTGLVDGLAETGFVTREPHPTDRRAALVTPTQQAVRAVAQMEGEQQELAQLLVGDLSPRQRAALSTGLAHVLDRLRSRLAEEASRG